MITLLTWRFRIYGDKRSEGLEEEREKLSSGIHCVNW